ncbi:Acetyltransferase [Minicystis rosea]|nr:Acetyltransferase [Minicystis rosea]
MLIDMKSVPVSNARLVRAFSRDFARVGGLLSPDYLDSGLSLGEARCLYELGQVDGITISALAQELGLDLGYVSRALSRLVAQRLAAKHVEKRDRRAQRVVLTQKGRRQLARLEERADHRVDTWLEAKPAPRVGALLAGLQGFLDDAGSSVEIRDARPGEIGRIITRHAEIYGPERGYPDAFEHYVVEAFAKFLKPFSPPRDRIFVADRGGHLLGSIAMKGLAGATAQLRFLLVEPEARGIGLGRRLVRTAIDHARASGERRVVLETASDLDAARALYAAHGFRMIKSVPGGPWLPRGVRSERWVLDLSAPAKS